MLNSRSKYNVDGLEYSYLDIVDIWLSILSYELYQKQCRGMINEKILSVSTISNYKDVFCQIFCCQTVWFLSAV